MKSNKTVMPKQAAPVERNSTVTAGAVSRGGCGPSLGTNPGAIIKIRR